MEGLTSRTGSSRDQRARFSTAPGGGRGWACVQRIVARGVLRALAGWCGAGRQLNSELRVQPPCGCSAFADLRDGGAGDQQQERGQRHAHELLRERGARHSPVCGEVAGMEGDASATLAVRRRRATLFSGVLRCALPSGCARVCALSFPSPSHGDWGRARLAASAPLAAWAARAASERPSQRVPARWPPPPGGEAARLPSAGDSARVQRPSAPELPRTRSPGPDALGDGSAGPVARGPMIPASTRRAARVWVRVCRLTKPALCACRWPQGR